MAKLDKRFKQQEIRPQNMIDSVFDFDADSGDEEMRPNTNPEPPPRSQSLLASAFDQMTEEDKAEMLKLLVPQSESRHLLARADATRQGLQ